MSDAERKPLWKRRWVWCVVSLAFVGVLANEGKRFYDRQIAVDKRLNSALCNASFSVPFMFWYKWIISCAITSTKVLKCDMHFAETSM